MTDMTSTARWLVIAQEITSSDRQRDYGRPLPNFLRIALIWNTVLGNKLLDGVLLTPLDVARLMVGMKLARDTNTFKDDNWIDTMGYAATVDDMNRQLKELGYEAGVLAFDTLTLDDYYLILQRVG